MDFAINWAGCYRHVQEYTQILDDTWLFLNVSGMRACRWDAPDGGRIYEAHQPGAYLLLVAGGSRFTFDYTSRRENWICSLHGLPLRGTADADVAEMQDGRVWIPLARRVMLTPEAARMWAVEMRRVRDAMRSPLPRNMLRARLITMGMLRFLLESLPSPEQPSAAERLRALIDADEACAKSLAELADACGYSADHLRIRFQETFGIAPQAYRMQRRMARAMELVMGSALPVKEISRMLGFPYVTHFSTAFKRAHGCSPRDALRRYRAGSA